MTAWKNAVLDEMLNTSRIFENACPLFSARKLGREDIVTANSTVEFLLCIMLLLLSIHYSTGHLFNTALRRIVRRSTCNNGLGRNDLALITL